MSNLTRFTLVLMPAFYEGVAFVFLSIAILTAEVVPAIAGVGFAILSVGWRIARGKVWAA